MKSKIQWMLVLAVIVLSHLGARDISTYRSMMEELNELQQSLIRELGRSQPDLNEIDNVEERIRELKTSRSWTPSATRGMYLIFGSFIAMAAIFELRRRAKNRENQSDLTTPENAPGSREA